MNSVGVRTPQTRATHQSQHGIMPKVCEVRGLALLSCSPVFDGSRFASTCERRWRQGDRTGDERRAQIIPKRAARRARDVHSGKAERSGIYEMELFDDETLGGHVTFEKFWEVLAPLAQGDA